LCLKTCFNLFFPPIIHVIHKKKQKKARYFKIWNAHCIFWKPLANNRGKKYVKLGAL
jgi:hypothetical protein